MNSLDLFNKVIAAYTLQQVPREWTDFIDFLDKIQPKFIIEVGTFTGGSAYTFSHFAKTIIAIDENDKFKKRSPILENCDLFFLNKSSKSGSTVHHVEKILKAHNTLADLLFIDGEHTYKGAKRDFKYYGKFVKPGGYIALHDVLKSKQHIAQNCLVYKFWDQLKQEYPNHQEIIYGRKWGGIGIIQLPQ